MSRIYESPDGKDCLEKTSQTTFTAFKLGSLWAAYEMVGRSKPNTLGAIATRYMYWTAPAVGIGATFAASGCLLGAIRGQDDFWNHIIAGASSATIIGVRYGPKNGCTWAVLFGAGAGLYKFLRDIGIKPGTISKPIVKDFGTFDHYRRHIGPRPEVKEPTNY